MMMMMMASDCVCSMMFACRMTIAAYLIISYTSSLMSALRAVVFASKLDLTPVLKTRRCLRGIEGASLY